MFTNFENYIKLVIFLRILKLQVTNSLDCPVQQQQQQQQQYIG